MQFSTVFAAVVALATGTNAAALGTRREAIATLEAYNFSTCDVDSVLTLDVVDEDCHNFDQGYGNAQVTLADTEQHCMFTLFSEKNCRGEVYWARPGKCDANTDGLARWSYVLTCA